MRVLIALLLLIQQPGPVRPPEVGVITGVIRTSDGTPTPGVRVFARPTGSASEDPSVLEAQTETDASGRYRLEIGPGQYIVGTGFLESPTWYPGTIDIKTARPVVVSSNATLSLDIAALPTSVIAGNIQVQIVSAVTRSPMEGVAVGISGILAVSPVQRGQPIRAVPRRAPTSTATTDASGNVVFRNLAPGRYSIQPRFGGYLMPNPSELVIDQTRVSQKLQVALTPSASISGRVTDAEGIPLSATAVYALRAQYSDGNRGLVTVARAETDSQGTFQLKPLEPGAYYVAAETISARLWLGSVYYPGTRNADEAMLVSVGNRQDLTGIDFKAPRVSTFSVSGRVQGASDMWIPRFNLAPHDRATNSPGLVTVANELQTPDGTFVLRGIPPGSWDLLPVLPARAPGIGTVEVVDRDVVGVAITLDRLTEIRGRVAMADGSALPQLGVRLVHRDNKTRNVISSNVISNFPQRARPDEFVFPGVPPGKYSVEIARVPPDLHVDSMRGGSRDFSETGVIEIGNGAIEPVEVILASGGSSFRGFFNVTLAYMSADQLRDVRVTLIPSGTRRSNLALYQTISIPRAGEPFSFSGVVPGDYKVFAWSKLPEGAEKSSAFLNRYEEFGTDVHVTEGPVGDIQVSVIAMP